MFPRSSALIRSRFVGFAALLALMAGCSSTPQSPPPIATSPSPTSPQATPNPTESPTSAPQSAPTQSTPDSAPDSAAPSTKTFRKVERCAVRMARVNDPESPLNVRSSPSANSKENIVGQIRNGVYVEIEDEQNGWYRIIGETPGWIAKSKTESTCTDKIERVEFGKGQDSIEVVDRFIGVGTHRYRLSLNKGQTLTLKRDRDVFPRVIAPDGTDLIQFNDSRKTWTGELPATGDYSIEFESNYKGYEYGFFAQVR